MSAIINDPDLLALLTCSKPIQFTDPSGRVLGVFAPSADTPIVVRKLADGGNSLSSEEDIAKRRQGPKTG